MSSPGRADEASTCPRCAGRFHCGVNDAGPCACVAVTLDSARLAALRARFDGCLCVACLVELQAAPARLEDLLAPRRN